MQLLSSRHRPAPLLQTQASCSLAGLCRRVRPIRSPPTHSECRCGPPHPLVSSPTLPADSGGLFCCRRGLNSHLTDQGPACRACRAGGPPWDLRRTYASVAGLGPECRQVWAVSPQRRCYDERAPARPPPGLCRPRGSVLLLAHRAARACVRRPDRERALRGRGELRPVRRSRRAAGAGRGGSACERRGTKEAGGRAEWHMGT